MAVYKILIKGTNGALAFATEKKEVMTKEIKTIDGVDTIVEVGTGKYVTGVFESEDVEVVKKKYVELMDTYKKDQLNCVIDVPEIVNITVDIEGENVNPSPTPDNNENNGTGNEADDNTTIPSQPSGDEGENNTDDETNNESGTGSDSDQNTGSEDTNASGEGTEGTDGTEETP